MEAVIVIAFFVIAIASWVIQSNGKKRVEERNDLRLEYPGLKVYGCHPGAGGQKYLLVDLFSDPNQPTIRFYDTYQDAWEQRAKMGDKESELVSLPIEHGFGSLRGIIQGHLQRNGRELEDFSERTIKR